MVTGYAVDCPATNDLPLEQWLAFRLARRLEALRRDAPDLQLGPDGKVIAVVEEGEDITRLAAFSTSLQQTENGPSIALHRAVRSILVDELALTARHGHFTNATLPWEQIDFSQIATRIGQWPSDREERHRVE